MKLKRFLFVENTFSLIPEYCWRSSQMFSKRKLNCLIDDTNIIKDTASNKASNKLSDKVIEDIVGVWVFHRHGDRTPIRSLVDNDMLERDTSFWKSRIPPGRSYYDALSQKFPTDVHHGKIGRNVFDVDDDKEPYGFLTFLGMDQMKQSGRNFAARYNTYGHCTVDGNTKEECDDNLDFLDSWDVKAYSTSYLRTVKSLQCFLDGLLGKRKPDSSLNVSYGNMTAANYLINDPPNSSPDVKVKINYPQCGALNAYDMYPKLMRKLVDDVVNTHEFELYDKGATPLAIRLANYLPGLKNCSNSVGPSGINWIYAADHFVCRSSHNLKYTSHSNFHNDMDAEASLVAMSDQTIAHLAWRFRQWYQHLPLLAVAATQPLRELENQIRLAKTMEVHERRPFVVYSCHDVTILSLLYSIGGKSWQNVWPPYASTLTFELVDISKKLEPASHVLRVSFSQDHVHTPSESVKPRPNHTGVVTVLKLCEFSDIVSTLDKGSVHKRDIKGEDCQIKNQNTENSDVTNPTK